MKQILILSMILIGFSTAAARADWTSFRNGGDSTTTKLPVKWSPESVAWQLELKGYGQSTPVIQGQQVFVASVVGEMEEHCLIQCLDLRDGKEHWQYEFLLHSNRPQTIWPLALLQLL